MTLHVGLDLTCLEVVEETGVERYARRLAELLPRIAPELTMSVITREGHPAPRVGEPGRLVSARPGPGRALWRETVLPSVVAAEGIRVLHAPVAAMSHFAHAKKVVTVHDAPARGVVAGEGGMLSPHRLRILHALSTADAIVVPSNATREALLAVDPSAGPRIHVIHHGVDADFRPLGPALARDRYGLTSRPYVLVVGTVRRRKDPITVVRAFAELRDGALSGHDLVIAGKHEEEIDALRDEIDRLELNERVKVPGYVAREDLPDLYREASVYVLASRIEGFGIPLIEAMASGTPVIAARTSAIPETAGDAARYFTAGDPSSLADALDAVIGDADLRADLRLRGFERARDFTWDACARRHADLYLSLA